ncbi:MAG: hypothetical protein EBU90_01745 [Proteobacteria bacterium]|nr:hypothetical protein [Pseudomonadota bacterium]
MINNDFKSLKILLDDLRITANQLMFLHILTEKGKGGNNKAAAINWFSEYLTKMEEQGYAPVTELDIQILIERGFISYIGSDEYNASTNDFIISHDYEEYINKAFKKEEIQKFGLELINRYPAFIKVNDQLFPSRSNIKSSEDSVVKKLTKTNVVKEQITDTEFYEYYYAKIEGNEETHNLLLDALDYIKKQELHTKPKQTFFSYGVVAFISTDRFRTAIDIYQSMIQTTNSFVDFDKSEKDKDQI